MFGGWYTIFFIMGAYIYSRTITTPKMDVIGPVYVINRHKSDILHLSRKRASLCEGVSANTWQFFRGGGARGYTMFFVMGDIYTFQTI